MFCAQFTQENDSEEEESVEVYDKFQDISHEGEQNRNTLMIQQHAKESLEKLTIESNLFHKSLSALLMVRPSQIKLGNTIGKGGFGEVTSIRQFPTPTSVSKSFAARTRPNLLALKKIRGSVIYSDVAEAAIIDLVKEAKFLKALSVHPNIITIHSSVGEIGKGYSIVIDKLQYTLQHLIHTEWKLKDKAINRRNFISRRNILEEDRHSLMKERCEVVLAICKAFV